MSRLRAVPRGVVVNWVRGADLLSMKITSRALITQLRSARSPRRICFAYLVLSIAAVQVPLAAQTVRGRLMSAADSSPIAGAIIQARTAIGESMASTVSATTGVFLFRQLRVGTYRLRVLRIGFQTFDAGEVIVEATAPASEMRLYWTARPAILANQRIGAQRSCRISTDSGTLVVRVWEEARKSLLTSLLAEERGALDITRLNLSRTLDSSGRIVKRQRIVSERAPSLHAYVSLAPDSLAASGYVRDDTSGVSFYAPDATALLSETFAATHCFAVREGSGDRAGDVGLSFEPNVSRSGRVDIRGTFWLDRRSWRLRQLTFLYDGLPPPAAETQSGGFVDFAALSDGALIVSNWRLRMPRLESRTRVTDGGARRVTLAPTSRIVAAIEEAGGVVVSARRDADVLYSTALPSLDIAIVSTSTAVPYGVASVSLDGTGLAADVDTAGRVHFPSLIEGRYRVSVRYPMLTALSVKTLQRDVTVHAGVNIDSIRAPSPEEVLHAACGTDVVRNRAAVIFGTLRDSHDHPTSGVVHVTWPASVKVIASRKRDDQLSWVDQMRGVLVGPDGQYKLCNVPRQGLMVHAEGSTGFAAKFARLYEAEPMRLLDLQLASRGAVARDDAPGAATLAYLELRVINADGSPSAGASVEVIDANGRRTTVRPDDAGRALLVSQPVGRTQISVKHGGAKGPTRETTLLPGRNLVVIELGSSAAARARESAHPLCPRERAPCRDLDDEAITPPGGGQSRRHLAVRIEWTEMHTNQ